MEARPLCPNISRSRLLAVFVCAVLGVACGANPTDRPTGPTEPVADLAVRVPEGWDAPINFDKDAREIGVAWANRGSAMAEDYSVVLLADGKVAYQWHKPLLAPGSERVETIGLGDLPDPYSLLQGSHRFELVLDPDQTVEDGDRNSNQFSTYRELGFDLPDLMLSFPPDADWEGPVVMGGTDIVFGREPEVPDRGYFLAYGVTGYGTGAASRWQRQTIVELNGDPIRQRDFVSELGTSASRGQIQISAVPVWKLAVSGEPLTVGEHELVITLDATNSVIEANEGNNALATKLDIRPSRARTTEDQPDRASIAVHPVYALPADAVDEQWDINGTIESIVADMQAWLRQRTDGRGVLWDESGETLDITFARLALTNERLAESPDWVQSIVEGLHAEGLNDPNKIYAVWYPLAFEDDGPLNCGVQSEYSGVKFALTFFTRVASGLNLCTSQPVVMVHELFHAFGAVASCAPNYFNAADGLGTAHVDDDPNDLLYSGERIGVPIELDRGNDDYFNHGIDGCVDTADSPYLERR